MDAFEVPRITARQAMSVAVLFGLVAMVAVITVASMLPLKERIPYFVEVETTTGKVAAAPDRSASAFKPDERNIRYFMNQWVINFLTIDSRTREYSLPASYVFLKGTARDKWAQFIDDQDKTIKRMIENPSLRRDVKIVSISFVGDGVALIRLKVNETGWTTPKSKALTVFYTIAPPSAEDKILINPIGFYITDFTINDELV